MGKRDEEPPILRLVLGGDLPALLEHCRGVGNGDDADAELREYRDRNGSTLLHYAAGAGHPEVCRHLLRITDAGIVSASGGGRGGAHDGRTPLHWAARNGHTSICELLV